MSRELALELDQHGNAIEHPGTARVVYRLNLPMLPATDVQFVKRMCS